MGEKLVCVNTYLIFRGEIQYMLIFPGGNEYGGKMSIAEYILIFWGEN